MSESNQSSEQPSGESKPQSVDQSKPETAPPRARNLRTGVTAVADSVDGFKKRSK